MSNSVEKPLSSPESILGRWIHQVIEPQKWHIRFHLRGNNLHVLFQGKPCPARLHVLSKLVAALRQTDLNSLLPDTHPQIYQVQLYGAQSSQTHPDWTALIYLNQLDRHWEQIQQEQLASTFAVQTRELSKEQISKEQNREIGVTEERPQPGEPKSSVMTATASQPQHQQTAAIALSNRSLARQGQETAIASYLSETLSDLGVAVRVSVKAISFTAASQVYTTDTATLASATKRLWISCEAAYSPEPTLIGEPISQKLRDLEIEGYRDAVILFQVAGEPRPDWMLRVDLTPPEAMLREWARWGDLEAIQCLLNQTVAHLGTKFSTASLKEQTLHLFCGVMSELSSEANPYPDQAKLKTEVLPLLETLAPQGIHAATLYGQHAQEEAPAWVEWIELPASQHPALSDSALTLAQQGDWEAIAFLLHRLLNPDLENYLTTGGIRLQLLPKQDLLHIMTEAVVCPDQRQVGYQIARFLKPLNLTEVTGVRVYGRRSGQRHPIWSYGVDFTPRDRIVPEATPEFAATDAYVGDLIARSDESVVLPDLTPADWQTAWKEVQQRTLHRLQHWLVRSQLFIPDANTEATALALPQQVTHDGFKLVAVWGAVGVLLTLQLNWLMGNSLRLAARSTSKSTVAISQTASPLPATVISSTAPVSTEEPSDLALPELDLPGSPDTDTDAFAKGGFTAPPEPTSSGTSPAPSTPAAPANLPYTPQDAATNLKLAETLATDPAIADFNSRQINDKLKLYYRLLEESGPPDILVIGSSRALRGVDPTQLEKELAELGYGKLKVFNFGVNGATAQVVDLIVRRLLTADQLPRMIVWADGARAFNSNGTDVTFNGIAVSPAYQQLVQGTLALPTISTSETTASATPAAKPAEGINLSLADSYQALDRWLSQQLARVSKTYPQRDQIKHLIQTSLTNWLPTSASSADAIPPDGMVAAHNPLNLPRDYELVDAKGFLSLAIQFNPATYYQKYAKVPGAYDRDYADFQIQGVQETALRTLLQYTQTQQVPVVFVNLPMTNEYLDPARMNYEQQFRDYMVNLGMQQPGFTFRDLGELWTTQYDYFSDPSHLNRYGAYAISHQLAQDPLVPWIKPEAKQP